MSSEKLVETAETPFGPITFDPITCSACGEVVSSSEWTDHARIHNPSAYRDGWPCNCRHGKPCPVHIDAPWMEAA